MTVTDANDGADSSQYRRLPPRVPPTNTESDVSPPAPATETKYVHSLSPAGSVQAYEQITDYMTTTARGGRLRTAILVILGLVFLAVVLSKAI